ncbi:coproporphyrinogen III oxidase [candidate division KSB1 bacterium]|nr:MAG: coproporphyrinogen III oxidase [candidate division KSB1 bacterium]
MKSEDKNISSNPGIYLHIPFCERKCGYCDFYSVTALYKKEPFVQSLLKEIEIVGQQISAEATFDTIYLGGGTPSLLTPHELELILQALDKQFKISSDCEITLEANPGTVIEAYLRDYRKLGVNRLSIGVQSFNSWELQLLERIHSADDALRTFRLARDAGFGNISIDLIYALPGQTGSHYLTSLQKAVELQPEHISAYNLIFEEGTSFFVRRQQGVLQQKDEDEEFTFFMMTNEFLSGHGYPAYEVSNYARSPRFYSRHNYKYWQHVPYLGFGPSAHSFWQGERRANARSLSRYLSDLQNGQLPVDFRETIDAGTEEFEYIFLRLRTYEGLNAEYFKQHFGRSFFESYRSIINSLLSMDYAQWEAPYFRLTKKGMAVCDEILPLFS